MKDNTNLITFFLIVFFGFTPLWASIVSVIYIRFEDDFYRRKKVFKLLGIPDDEEEYEIYLSLCEKKLCCDVKPGEIFSDIPHMHIFIKRNKAECFDINDSSSRWGFKQEEIVTVFPQSEKQRKKICKIYKLK